MSDRVLLMFSSWSFIIYGLTFRSVVHFELIFVYGVRKCSNFIVLNIAVQFYQNHLLKRLSFLHCIFLPPLSKIRYLQVSGFISGLSILFHWSIFVFVPMPYCPDDCSFVVQFEVRRVDSSSFILQSQDYFGYSGSFVFPYKL